jgi:hypothetical protein
MPRQHTPIIIPFCQPSDGSDDVLIASQLSFHGGKTALHVPPGVYENVANLDFVSAYPFAMTQFPPVTKGHWERVTERIPDAAAVYRVRGHVRGRCPYGVFMRTGSTALVREGVFDLWTTGWELDAAADEIDVTIIEGYRWVPAADATNPFKAYVLRFFEEKRRARKTNPRRERAKLLLNSLYGKLGNTVSGYDPVTGSRRDVASGLFNPFWATQITGHCRARLHQLEHQYQALHSSTDAVLTQAASLTTGHNLGDVELGVKKRGTLIILRRNLYVLLNDKGRILKAATAGVRRSADLLQIIRQRGAPYTIQHMVRPREALRTGRKPFQMEERTFQIRGVSPVVWSQAADALRRLEGPRV